MLDKAYKPQEIESKWAAAWKRSGAFTADSSSKSPSFAVVLPPPNVTGQLHVGHALGTTVQDVIVRWKRLKGYNVLFLAGTDHAGIATQKVVERYLEERGIDKDVIGREGFLKECWKWKEKYHGRIVRQLDKLGASLDWSREVFTLDEGVSRAVRQVFVHLYEKGLVYRGRYIVNWCPSCRTAISDEEVEFRERQGKLYYIAYPLARGDGEVVVGTTRPETMLGDVAVAIAPGDERAPELEGRLLSLPLTEREIPVIVDDAVDPEFGTGSLKVTPAHDPLDFEIGQRHGLSPFIVIDRDGRMNENAGAFAGMDRDEARERILEALEEKGYLRKIEDYDHSVGHHDRCDTVIEPAISRQWFLKMESLAKPGMDVVRRGEIEFLPERWKNIYLSWMENIRDWCISRQLWWGHRIPVWYCNGCGMDIVSVLEPRECPGCGGSSIVQDEDVLDTWFSSWLWTFSPMGWPERTEDLETFHPTDVLVTAGDIIFFWVARMIMAALEFMDEIPFSTVYITGIVRDEKGRKMSKSLGNSPDPIEIIENNGSDAFRFTLMMLSPPGQDIMFSEKKVDVGRHFANKIWNSARFVLGQGDAEDDATGGNDLDGAADEIAEYYESLFDEKPPAGARFGWEDMWILSRLSDTAGRFERSIDGFRFDEAAKCMYDFFWHEYCDWYLELAKPALKEGGERAAGTLTAARTVLGVSMTMLHPFMPFITEEIWSRLSDGSRLLADTMFGGVPSSFHDPSLEADVGLFIEIVVNIRNLRQNFNIAPGKSVNVLVNCEPGKGTPDRLKLFEEQLKALARIDRLEISIDIDKPEVCAAAGLSSVEVYIPLEGIVDYKAEIERLKHSMEKLESDCGKIKRRLDDGRFIENAPADVVARERERFEELIKRRSRIEKILEDLG